MFYLGTVDLCLTQTQQVVIDPLLRLGTTDADGTHTSRLPKFSSIFFCKTKVYWQIVDHFLLILIGFEIV